jgi:hypothetical protein
MGRRETVSYPVFKVKCPMCDKYMGYYIRFDPQEPDPPFNIQSLGADGFPFFFDCGCGNTLMRTITENSMENMFEMMEIVTVRPRELFHDEDDEIDEKLDALEDIFGLLDDLTPEQRERFDEIIERQKVKKKPILPAEKVKNEYHYDDEIPWKDEDGRDDIDRDELDQ